MTTPDALIAAITAQNEYMTSIAVAGMGVNVLVFGSMYGVVDDFNLRGFRGKYWLILPFLLFLLAYLAGGVITSSTTGFFVETLSPSPVRCAKDSTITSANPQEYYICEYLPTIGLISRTQYGLNLFGILLSTLWFSINIFFVRRHRNEQQQNPNQFYSVHWNYVSRVELGSGQQSREPARDDHDV